MKRKDCMRDRLLDVSDYLSKSGQAEMAQIVIQGAEMLGDAQRRLYDAIDAVRRVSERIVDENENSLVLKDFQAGIPSLEDMHDMKIDITGGKDLADFFREMRGR